MNAPVVLNVEEVVASMRRRAQHARSFVRQLDAPTLHKVFNSLADMLEEGANALEFVVKNKFEEIKDDEHSGG